MDRNKILAQLNDEQLESFFYLFHELKSVFTENMLREFNRSLPIMELFSDRWERARILGYGEGASVYDSCCIFGKVTVGKNTWVGPFTILDGSGGLSIGDFAAFRPGYKFIRTTVLNGQHPVAQLHTNTLPLLSAAIVILGLIPLSQKE